MRFVKNLKAQHQVLALEKESRTIGPLGLELLPCNEGNHQTISSKFEPFGQISFIHVQMHNTMAWNEIFQKFKRH